MVVKTERKVDRRIQRTQQMLRDALIELIVEKGYDAVSIQDISDRANVARTTFYLHYTDKEELLLKSMMEVYDDLVVNMDKTPGLMYGLLPDGTPAEIIVFQHVQENADFYRVLLVQPGFAVFINRARHYLAEMFEEHIDECFPDKHIPAQSLKAITHREAGALIGMVCWWLENDLKPSALEMAHTFYNSGHSGIWHAMGVEAPTIP